MPLVFSLSCCENDHIEDVEDPESQIILPETGWVEITTSSEGQLMSKLKELPAGISGIIRLTHIAISLPSKQ